jgi:hypothetical protein
MVGFQNWKEKAERRNDAVLPVGQVNPEWLAKAWAT